MKNAKVNKVNKVNRKDVDFLYINTRTKEKENKNKSENSNSPINFYAQHEPRLITLKRECIRARNTIPKRYRNHYWYKVLKPLMSSCVGFGAESENELLHSCEVYDCIYGECISILGI